MTCRLPALLAVSLLTIALAAPRARAADVITWNDITLSAQSDGNLYYYDNSSGGTGPISNSWHDAPPALTSFGQVQTGGSCGISIPSQPPYYPGYYGGYVYGSGTLNASYSQSVRTLYVDYDMNANPMLMLPPSSGSCSGGAMLTVGASFSFNLGIYQTADIWYSENYAPGYRSVAVDGNYYTLSSGHLSLPLISGSHTISLMDSGQIGLSGPYGGGGGGGYYYGPYLPQKGQVAIMFNGDGLNPYSAFVPSSITHGTSSTTWDFPTTPTGTWVDPPATSEFTYTMDPASNSLFTDIQDFPEGFDAVTVTAEGHDLGTFSHNQSLNFAASILGHAVSSFTVSGINPSVDAQDSTAFPLKLAFDTSTASFSMTSPVATPEDVPEPASLALLTLGTAALLARRRTRRSRD